ncbi:MAG: YdcH family protein [Devosia sp.]
MTKEQEAALGLELASKRQEHADLDAAIHTLSASGLADQMLLQRLKKRKLSLKDRIVQLENLLLPDIIA